MDTCAACERELGPQARISFSSGDGRRLCLSCWVDSLPEPAIRRYRSDALGPVTIPDRED